MNFDKYDHFMKFENFQEFHRFDKKYNYLKVISKSAYKANKKSLGHEYKAELLQYIGNYTESIKFYELAKAHNMKGYMVDKRIDAKIAKVKTPGKSFIIPLHDSFNPLYDQMPFLDHSF